MDVPHLTSQGSVSSASSVIQRLLLGKAQLNTAMKQGTALT